MLKKFYHFFKKHKIILFFSLSISTCMVFASIFLFKNLPNVIPIFYSFLDTRNQLTNKYWIFIFPLLSIIFNLLNFSLLPLVKKFTPLFCQLILQINFFYQVLLLIAFLRIIYLIY